MDIHRNSWKNVKLHKYLSEIFKLEKCLFMSNKKKQQHIFVIVPWLALIPIIKWKIIEKCLNVYTTKMSIDTWIRISIQSKISSVFLAM